MAGIPREELEDLLREIVRFPWLKHAGEPWENATVVTDVATAWDEWNKQMLAVWLPRTHDLESRAIALFGEDALDQLFSDASRVLDEPIRLGLLRYFDRRPVDTPSTASASDLGLWPEVLATIERDIAWALVETALGAPDFFTHLLDYYRAGRWPCAWTAEYPGGSVVLL